MGLTGNTTALSFRTRAGIAQLVEHDLAKVGVASSSLVSRSISWRKIGHPAATFASRARQSRASLADEIENFIRRHIPVPDRRCETPRQSPARWQSGHAADCKSAYAGSIPTLASS